eukprot:COSAG02_NODE_47684_length_339_cov_0.929167_1_plen_63_part_10
MKHIVEVRERVDETVSITETRHTGQTRPRIGGARGKPGPGYVCHLCGKPGHWKEQCWTAKRG